ncbi:hypothetical protein FSARC_4558 [Fusarium sarcochroum]|uniref:Nephrocystin 3-like N-terminal domain-containing protein n=1 Tax=Fusarium sarcochroum TaxID=1208366 RepID=A0A8H4XAJ2_9HYPO|nr:hypothetical protein FSARC_4558 [Fusarium sarcochroum]
MDQSTDHELPGLLPETTPSSTRRPFWEEMFHQAMEELQSTRDEPVKLVETSNSIRTATGWVEIVNILEIARAKYYGYSGFIGFWKRAGHKMTDHANDGKMLLSLLPNTEYSSIIHCVFDAAKRTAKIREEIETSLRQFREKLEDVESIVAVYTNEDEIVAAASNVLVSILQAIEDIVAYYWANKGRKIAKALWRGEDYKTDLTECLDGLSSSSRRLMEKANIGNFRETRSVNVKASEGLEKLKELQLDHIRMVKEQRRLADAQSQMNDSGRKMTLEQRRLASGLKREASANTRNAAANEMNAAVNMANATISAVALNAFDRLSQEYLTAISERERALRLNTQLLVTNARLSSELKAERSRSRDRRPPLGSPLVSQAQLLRMVNLGLDLDISNAEEIGMDFISTSTALVNRRDQGRAEQLVGDPKLRQWIVKTSSTELLIHGNMKPSRTSVSPLSLFTASIVRSLRNVHRFCAIAFFCGQHTDLDDPLTGGFGLIKSLIAQLLDQHHFDDADLAHVAQDVNLSLLKRDMEDIEELCQLFAVLVRRLRSDTTLFCVLDSVNVYEDEEYMQDMHVDRVLYEILSLTQDKKVKTHVKILLTSPTDTNMISAGFQQKDILAMSGRLSVDKHFSDRRLSRNFQGALESE